MPTERAAPEPAPRSAATGAAWRRPLATIQGRLLALLLLAALPGAALVVLHAHTAHDQAERRLQRRVELLREAAAARHVAAIEAAEQTLAALSRALPPDRRAGPVCEALLRDVAAGLDGRYTVLAAIDAAGGVRCASLPSAVGANLGDRPWLAELRRGRGFTIGGFEIGRLAGVPMVTAAVRLAGADGGFAGALAAGLPLEHFTRRGGRAVGGDGAGAEEDATTLLWLLDGTGAPLPLTQAATPPVLPQPEDLRRASALAPVTFAAEAVDGTALFLASARLGRDLTLVVGERAAGPMAEARAETWRRLFELTVLFSLILLAVGLGARFAVIRPLERLRDAVAGWRGSETAFDPGDLSGMPDEVRDLAEGFRRSTARLAAHEAELRAALESRELLMAEMHHRVKNNLQIVSSLLNLQSQRIVEPGARAEFEAARDRVRALATLHRHLYMHPDHETIDLRAFIEELAGQLFQAMEERPGGRIALLVEAPALRISSDQAVPLALVITEAVTDALNHAFPAGRRGRLEVLLATEAERAHLRIRDDGVAGGPDRPAERRGGLGGQLVRGLARQLGGELRVEAGEDGGRVVSLDFPLRAPVVRPPPALRPAAAHGAGGGAATPTAPPPPGPASPAAPSARA